ncbi:serine hydrolase [Mycobacterium helveticum]|uniref:Serine hydrolase n=1 Tax=Mycobacterium helveticum TaxID=2592811 RepID=A0A557XM63_9MYCO|nr:serine hydrolase [Mycobacterium helveticum]TVS84330.1 serine hydrolase [Mycobacterium helveticum]TVS86910.1 serine hydrolase [Mycobacterium helveticum]
MTPRSVHLLLESSFERLSTALPAEVGIAVARSDRTFALGPFALGPFALGRWQSGVAWSTIKVPLAVAALRSDRTQAAGLLGKAITESDNPAAEALWSQLGEPADAARRVQDVIAEAGDDDTVVESRRIREGFTPFGQTQWSLARQAGFAARLPSLGEAATVIALMHRLTDAQRWGLAVKGFAAKGGWGPGLHGDYLVRQFGIIPAVSGHIGVALAAQADSFEAGAAVLNTMADWLLSHLPELAEG